jgi:ABC-2 type transport system permease protein
VSFSRDVFAVLRKELLELVGSRKTARGPLVQASIVVAVAGVLIPMSGPVVWTDPRVSALLFFLFPSTLAASVAADSFAGERERRTLETLLTTPLSDASILVAKAMTAVIFAVSAAAAALLAGLVTVNLHRSRLFVPSAVFFVALLGAALATALTTSALAVAVSMRVNIARSAQQLSAIITLVVVGAVAATLKELALTVDWPLILRIDAALAAIGLASLAMLLRLFRRDRLLERR